MGGSRDTFTFDDAPRDAEPDPEKARYRFVALLGRGAMGEVFRVHDTRLDRLVALKVLRDEHAGRPGALDRFVVEARAVAALQHPAIVPVLDHGTLPDGRLFYTMPEVTGPTLLEVLRTLDRRDRPAVRRALQALLEAARAIGHAHRHGVVHRDIKPEHVLLSEEDGSARVLDWGIASTSATATPLRAGTPGYMSPEQESGGGVGPEADVYALGRVLREIVGSTPDQPAVPRAYRGLSSLIERATSTQPDRRPPDGDAFAAALESWLTGQAGEAAARTTVDEAIELAQWSSDTFAKGRSALLEAMRLGSELPRDAPVEACEASWRLERQGHDALRESEAAASAAVERAQAALQLAPGFEDAHAFLAEAHRHLHGLAELTRGRLASDHLERIQLHAEQLPDAHLGRAQFLRYAAGEGGLSLRTEPAGATVYGAPVSEGLRGLLVAGEEVRLGTTPIDEVPLTAGSWILRIEAPGRSSVTLPVWVPRAGVWMNERRDDRQAAPTYLPRADEIAADEVWVPGSLFRAGEAELLGGGWKLWELWCDAFVIRIHPVTVAEWCRFLDALESRGEMDLVARWQPPHGGLRRGSEGFEPDVDEDGDLWDPDWPMVWVSFAAARAFAAWTAERTGLPWRLPGVLEWEKAARGADARPYPWGLRRETRFSRMVNSPERSPCPVRDMPPQDTSPYGVRGMGGNVQEWCDGLGSVHCRSLEMLERWRPRSGTALLKGNGWSTAVHPMSRPLNRAVDSRSQCTGLRLARSLPRAALPIPEL